MFNSVEDPHDKEAVVHELRSVFRLSFDLDTPKELCPASADLKNGKSPVGNVRAEFCKRASLYIHT